MFPIYTGPQSGVSRTRPTDRVEPSNLNTTASKVAELEPEKIVFKGQGFELGFVRS